MNGSIAYGWTFTKELHEISYEVTEFDINMMYFLINDSPTQ